ncbi:hypothetical protein K3495_g14125 [Podosphaera aphanis]|nr:hypothetical protein K3495_g14125 [Podosphaera aphanis]
MLKVAAFQEWANSWEGQGRRQNPEQRASADPEIWRSGEPHCLSTNA